MTEKTPNCSDCKFAVHMDYGYSNYTTEGTEFACGLKKHPDGQFDEFYGEDKRLSFAEKCERFESGEGVWMDVDHENESELTPDQRALYDAAVS